MTVRRVAVGTSGPAIAESLILEPAFGIATAAAHLRDALQRMQRFSRSQGGYVALEGTSQIAVDEVVRALELLDTLGKQSDVAAALAERTYDHEREPGRNAPEESE